MFKQNKTLFQKQSIFTSKRFICKNLSRFTSMLFVFFISFLCPYQTFSDNASNLYYDYSPWSSYAPSIEQCSLGQFTLPDPVAITLLKLRLQSLSNTGPEAQAKINSEIGAALVTIEIFGWVNNYCHVVYKSARQGQNADNSGLGPLGFDCNFTRDEVKVLAAVARKLAAGQLPLTGEDPTAKIKGRACRSLVQNVPHSPTTDANMPVYFIQ